MPVRREMVGFDPFEGRRDMALEKITPEIEAVLNKELPVLDHGFVRLVDFMGSDAAIVQAARVSYGEGTTKKSRDRELIRYLLGHDHTSPFEMVEFKFHVKLPIFVARQWIRHRTANVNEYSGRYSVMKDEFYVPEETEVKLQSKLNHQSRSDQAAPDEVRQEYLDHLRDSQKDLYEHYSKFIDAGLARELARINLPLSLYTEWYWKIDLHNLLRFLRLRLAPDAQQEIRVYAQKMGEILKAVCPITWEAFEDYILNAQKYSVQELRVMQSSLADLSPTVDSLVEQGLSKLEAEEFIEKLQKIRGL
jgi:thymidylate synthase (FAD)